MFLQRSEEELFFRSANPVPNICDERVVAVGSLRAVFEGSNGFVGWLCRRGLDSRRESHWFARLKLDSLIASEP